MSFQTRQCFLYLARFPEDHIIDVFELKLLWIAEEFISEADEEDGIELLSLEGQVLRFRVHDLVRDLAIEKAMDHKVLGIFDSNKQHQNTIRSLQGQSRHAIYNGINEYLKLLGPNSDAYKFLRSLAITNRIVRPEVEVKMMYTRFKYLKVLDLSSAKNSYIIPEEIGDLILLKFLCLMGGSYGKVFVIPPSVGKLKRLQTISGSFTYKFPKEMCELKEIRGSGGEEEADYSCQSIANLKCLRTLRLSMGYFRSTIQPLGSCKHLKRVTLFGKMNDPKELSWLPDSVIDLTLGRTFFEKDPMPTLGSLSNLTALRLGDSYSGEKMVCSADAFLCLQYLTLNAHGKLEEFQVNEGALLSFFSN
ncbi:putative disease resistance protein RXW24L [Apium graveolens]|uniref:putative disease resistance protein RXW24L n=1 Tax=Apium graveolens TaxID=4045 RepID=UPI003D79DE80